MKAVQIVVMLALLVILSAQTLRAQADRWEWIAEDVDGYSYYLDIKTVVRPESGVVVFWLKKVKGDYRENKRIKMWCRVRKCQRIDEPGYRVQDVAPESIMEAFLDRLCH